MSDSYRWQAAGGGSFSGPTNWIDVETGKPGVPSSDDQTSFDVNDSVSGAGSPATYTVSCDGQTVQGVVCSDNVTFSGGLTGTEGIQGTGDLTLISGTYSSKLGITADDVLSCDNATLNADGIAAEGGLTVSESIFNVSGDLGAGILANGEISVTGSHFNAEGVNFTGVGTIENSTMKISTGPLIGDGEIDLTASGALTMKDDALSAPLGVTLLGLFNWDDGSIVTKTLTVGVDPSSSLGKMNFYGTTLKTSSVEDSQSEPGARIIFGSGKWTNSGAIASSATYSLGGALTTKSFVAGKTGDGATILVENGGSLTVTSNLAAQTITIQRGSKASVGGNASFAAMAGSVSGAGAALTVGGVLSSPGASPFSITQGAKVTAHSVSAANGWFSVKGAGARLNVDATLSANALQVGIGGSAEASTINVGILTVDGGAVSTALLHTDTIAVSSAGSLKVAASLTLGTSSWNTGTVDGGGSSLSVGGALTVENGELTISSEGAATAKDMILAGVNGASVLIEDSKSLLSVMAGLTVGSALVQGQSLTVEKNGRASVGSDLTLFDGDQISLSGGGGVVIGGTSAIVNTIAIRSHGTFREEAVTRSKKSGLVNGSVFDSGKLLLLDASDLTITGYLGGPGVVTLDAKSELEVEREASTHITFDGAGATLTLLDSLHFAGELVGFKNSDALELGDILYEKGKTTFTFTENSHDTAGLLKVSDGTHSATIELLGDYAKQDFALGHGLNGGTLVTERG
jgi:hypothetical protein